MELAPFSRPGFQYRGDYELGDQFNSGTPIPNQFLVRATTNQGTSKLIMELLQIQKAHLLTLAMSVRPRKCRSRSKYDSIVPEAVINDVFYSKRRRVSIYVLLKMTRTAIPGA